MRFKGVGYLLLKNPWNLTVDQTKEGRYTLNRSPDAHRENRPKPPDAIDPYLTVLRVDRVDGNTIRPLAVYSVFAIHGTAVPLENTLWNGDVQAAMAPYLEWKVKAGKDSGFMHLTANGNEGDIRPYYSQTIRRKNHYAEAHRIGKGLADTTHGKFDELKPATGSVKISTAYREFDTTNPDDLCGKRKSKGRYRPAYGVPTLAGSEDGPTRLRGHHGVFEGARLLKSESCQGHKKFPLQWDIIKGFFGIDLSLLIANGEKYPRWLSVQVVRIGELLLVTVPGEATAEMGRRIKCAVKDALPKDSDIQYVALVGLANQYASYFTTSEEYGEQHYEGGSTIYGPKAGAYVQSKLVSLATESVEKGGDIEYSVSRKLTQPRNNGLWPKYDNSPSRSVDSKKPPRFDKDPVKRAVFTWRDVDGPASIQLHLPLVKIQVSTKSGEKDYVWKGVPQDDQGLDIEIARVEKDRWEARWYYGGHSRTQRYRFVFARRDYDAQERKSEWFSLP